MFGTVDRTLISVLAEPIKAEFGLSDGGLGLLTGLAFAISYSIAGIPLGLVVDRVRRTSLLASLVAIWSGLTFFSGMATSAVTLALARIGVGASEAGARSEEHTSELQSLMRISYAVFCLNKKTNIST